MYTKISIALILISLLYSFPLMACSVFHVTNKDGQVLIGRNFDFGTKGGQVWFIKSEKKKHGIAIFEQMGHDMPYDGMNDKGLFVAITAVPSTDVPFSFFKPMRKSLELVRIILEQADDVDTATKIFSKYSILFGTTFGNPLIHFMIVDKNGDSAIVEYVNNEVRVIKENKDTGIMTNHYLSDAKEGYPTKSSFERFDIIKNALIKDNYSIDDIQKILKDVSQNSTIYSNVYDLKNFTIYTTYQNSATITYNLKDELFKNNSGYNLDRTKDVATMKYLDKGINLCVRPHLGIGYNGSDIIYHYGGRILLPVDGIRKYGVEITGMKNGEDDFLSLGILLEQRLFKWFNMSIGTVGYFDYDDSNVIGLLTNLGWEPDNHIPFKPFVTYRSEMIFYKSLDMISSVSVGFNIEF